MRSNAAEPPAAGEGWQRLEALFHAGSDLAASERDAWLAGLPADDAALVPELRALLAAHDRGGDFVAAAVHDAEREMGAGEDLGLEGKRVGAYRLVRLLGRGGMGAVYLAERADEVFRQRVAIKLLPWALATPEARHRFQAERQTLAALEHPRIARLLDGGETADGLPFLVMEYVDGEPIDVFCERRRLDVDARLRLFREVCSAVEHAHRNLVVHRDLKPANILVTAAGEVKLLDFGIAKLLPGASNDFTAPLTQVGRLLLTPLYASPEQLRGDTITTATDIYALGLLLFRLLTGLHPYRLATTSPVEVARVVLEQPPTRPSHAAAAATAGLGLPALRRRLRGDLDNIVLVALRKEPERRYASVGQLSEDVQRHLAQMPVRARPDTLAYRTTKFVRRHRLGLAAALLLALSLLGGLLATVRQARIAERRFQDVRALATSLLFEVHDAIAPLPGSTPARQLLVRKALAYLDRLAAEADGEPALELELATAYQKVGDVEGNPAQPNLGDLAGALAAYDKAAHILSAQLRRSPASAALRRELGHCERRRADALAAEGKTAAAIDRYRQAIALQVTLAAGATTEAPWLDLARSHIALADLLQWNDGLGDGLLELAAARGILERLERRERLSGPGGPQAPALSPPSVIEVRRQLGVIDTKTGDTLCWQDRCREAVAWHTHALGILEPMARANPNDTATLYALLLAHLKMGEAMEGIGDAAGRLAAYEKSLAVGEAMAAADPRNARATRILALAHCKLGDAQEARRDFTPALAHYRTALALQNGLAERDPANLEHQRDLANTHNRIGEALLAEGRPADALVGLGQALRLREWLVQRDPQDVFARRDPAVSYDNLGDVHWRLAHAATATDVARRADLRQAHDLYGHGLALWAELRRRGGFRAADQGEVDRVTRSLHDCDTALAAAGKN